MQTLGLGLIVLLVCGLAIKQIVTILLEGSIFEGLRIFVHTRMKAASGCSRGVWRKLHELFTCDLCISTQVSIWMFALPISVGAHLRWPHPFEHMTKTDLPLALEILTGLLLWFVDSMALSAVALGLREALGYPAKKLKAQQEYYRELIELKELELKQQFPESER